ncbi:hypothetical protein HPP92_005815 [Vanilla planifolia]|uniref:Polygalacturonase n=1 Tax=Vanilla planifolia TaxID=51239 RepID=A0A835RUC8_VANPL|nr:hypothetical protein HPP92_005815 [Vanilla planifolia]
MNLKDWKEEGTAHWILFENIDNLTVGGGGTVVGNGRTWWKNSCKINRALVRKPLLSTNLFACFPKRLLKPFYLCSCSHVQLHQRFVLQYSSGIGIPSFRSGHKDTYKSSAILKNLQALTFYSCNHLTVENLSILESQQIHLSVETCSDVRVSHLDIDSPESSPNTDGIHVSNTKNMVISGCVIKAGEHFDKAAETLVSSSSVPLMLQKTIPGDDCVSIASGSRNIKAMDTVCGPGHGIRSI